MRILVVDDEVRLATGLARTLRQEGFAVDVAHDGEEGAVAGDGAPLRRHRARRHAAEAERLRRAAAASARPACGRRS